MVTLQKFIEKHYNKEVEEIDISKKNSTVWSELEEEIIKGKELDLGDYKQLKRLRIDGSLLDSKFKILTLNNPELTLLTITNNMDLEILNIAGCSKLKTLKLNHHEPNNLPYIFKYSKTKIIGWEDTKLWDENEHDKLKAIIQTRIEDEGEESWEHTKIFSSDSSSDENQEELINEVVEVPPKNNNCNTL